MTAKQQALDPQAIALVRVATAIALGDDARLRDRLRAARGAAVPDLWIEELLLQSLLNVGYPLTLVAFATWREVAGPGRETGEPLDHPEWAQWAKRGAEVCATVYGRTYHKLLLNLRGLHPALEPLVVVDAYGKILGRPGFDPKLRELCTLSAIAMLNAPRQLHAHLRGALNVGWTREDVDAVLAVVEADLDAAGALKVWELWADVRGRNL
ncbi:MAG: carboxymuconolactone decarboxylase family protein [Gemmatimonadetes bacterium]|nr:carboxymuconolactone decarboxylase family protein [Gemmatimonadota bacterium]